MSTRRQLRVAELLQRELAQLITYDLGDPRLQFVSVTRVDVTPDLRQARVYVSHLGDESAAPELIASLQRASGHLRRELGQRTLLRYVPELQFFFDQGLIASLRIEALLGTLTDAQPAEADGAAEREDPLAGD